MGLFLRYLGALGATKAAGEAPLVRACLDREGADTEPWFDAAIAALGKLGSTEDGERLGALWGNADYSSSRRQVIVKALGLLKATDAVPALSALAQDNDAGVALRVQAVEALGDAGDAASFPVLLTLYGQTNPFIRAAVVKAAAALGGVEAETMMLSAIRDDQARVRLAAVEGIKRLGLDKAAPYLLLRAKNDPEQSLRFAAFDALAALNSQEGVDFLLGVVKEKKSADAARVRAAAALL
jgi:HEAT repeat protein